MSHAFSRASFYQRENEEMEATSYGKTTAPAAKAATNVEAKPVTAFGPEYKAEMFRDGAALLHTFAERILGRELPSDSLSFTKLHDLECEAFSEDPRTEEQTYDTNIDDCECEPYAAFEVTDAYFTNSGALAGRMEAAQYNPNPWRWTFHLQFDASINKQVPASAGHLPPTSASSR
jgi:hypothetical protein